MHIIISLVFIGLSISLPNFSEAQVKSWTKAEDCDSITKRLAKALNKDGFQVEVNPIVPRKYVYDASTQIIQVTAMSNWEPSSFGSLIIRKGLHSTTYKFKNKFDQYTSKSVCTLEGIDLSFRPIYSFLAEEKLLSEAQCSLFAEKYDREIERMNKLSALGKSYLSLLDSSTEKFGYICSQVYQVL